MVKNGWKWTKNSIFREIAGKKGVLDSSSSLFIVIFATAPGENIFVNKNGGRIKGSHNIITRCCCNDISGEKATPSSYHPIFRHLIENWIFDHFWPFVPVHGQPLDPNFAFIDKTIITGCCCNDIYGEKATPGYYHPIFPPLAWKFNFWPFLAIFHL